MAGTASARGPNAAHACVARCTRGAAPALWAGLTPTPYQSGQARRELGIAKAGHRHIRAMAIEIAWAWRRFQPASALAQWYERRFGAGSARLRKLGMVALARKLLIALWRFVKTGVLPEGAVLKTVPRQ
jgi:transposase